MHEIELLVDVRSNPFSKYSHQFDHDRLKASVVGSGRRYLFLGRELGGKPKEESFYDDEGRVQYCKLAASAPFQAGMAKLVPELRSGKVALLCGEENPTHCHRRLLVGKVLERDHQIAVLHIRKGGVIQTDSDIDKETTADEPKQLSLFDQNS